MRMGKRLLGADRMRCGGHVVLDRRNGFAHLRVKSKPDAMRGATTEMGRLCERSRPGEHVRCLRFCSGWGVGSAPGWPGRAEVRDTGPVRGPPCALIARASHWARKSC